MTMTKMICNCTTGEVTEMELTDKDVEDRAKRKALAIESRAAREAFEAEEQAARDVLSDPVSTTEAKVAAVGKLLGVTLKPPAGVT